VSVGIKLNEVSPVERPLAILIMALLCRKHTPAMHLVIKLVNDDIRQCSRLGVERPDRKAPVIPACHYNMVPQRVVSLLLLNMLSIEHVRLGVNGGKKCQSANERNQRNQRAHGEKGGV